jgi:predicted GTPase
MTILRLLGDLQFGEYVPSEGSDADEVSALALADLLSLAANSVANPSTSQAKLLEAFAHLRERFASERFQLAVLGQFKRGKSTLLNALLRGDVLPVGGTSYGDSNLSPGRSDVQLARYLQCRPN